MTKIILASNSPRRRELLGALAKEVGFSFEVITREVDEHLDGKYPFSGVEVLAVRKGAAVYKDYPDALVISSDTLVELDGEALGKPIDKMDAYRMLRSLSGRGHEVHTGIAVHYKGEVYSGVATTEVRFKDLSDEEIDAYIESGEPMDKAGAYGIQGGAGKFVSEYIGDFDTVVGFSMALFSRLVCEAVGSFSALTEGQNND